MGFKSIAIIARLFLVGNFLFATTEAELTTVAIGDGPLGTRAGVTPTGHFWLLNANSTHVDSTGSADIFRWVVSAASVNDVSVVLKSVQWMPLTDYSGSVPPGKPLIDVHSAQVWADVKIVQIDLYPWRTRAGVVEYLSEAEVEISINHSGPVASRIEKTAVPVLNRRVIRWQPEQKRALRKGIGEPPDGFDWLKIEIPRDGIYAITGADIQSAGADPAALHSASIRLFGPVSLGRPHSSKTGAPIPANMTEQPIILEDGGDDILDLTDRIIFYATGAHGVDLQEGALVYRSNPYSASAYVWLLIPSSETGLPGTRIAAGPAPVSGLTTVQKGRAVIHHEKDIFNGISSGPVWHQTTISNGDGTTIYLDVPAYSESNSTTFKIRMRGNAHLGRYMPEIQVNQAMVRSGGNYSGSTDITLDLGSDLVSPEFHTGANAIGISNESSSASEIWLDWIELEYDRDIIASDDQYDVAIDVGSGLVNITLSDYDTAPLILNITNPQIPIRQQSSSDAGRFFTLEITEATSRFAIATADQYLSAATITRINNLTFNALRNSTNQADYIIIAPEIFRDAAEELATLHSTEVRPDHRLSTFVVSVDEVMREFSGGTMDPMSIRYFLRWAYENWARPAPTLVLLFGDGDYDYRNISGQSNNLVPTIQLDGATDISSYSTDDRYVYLDSVNVINPLADMGLGRIPASNLQEAEAVVAAIRQYVLYPEPGAWRQSLVLAADDPVRPNDREPNFVYNSEGFARKIAPFLKVNKLYLTEYAEVLDPSTNSIVKPAATEDLIRLIAAGQGLINYIGHGSATQWAQEKLLVMERDRERLEPGEKLPIWFAGTCTWGRYDQLDIPAMTEAITSSVDITGIAAISATRAVYSGDNTAYLNSLFDATFPYPSRSPSPARLGAIFQASKSGSRADEKFHLFGDPAIHLPFPSEPLEITSVSPDTLNVLGTASFAGSADNISKGEVLITVSDAEQEVKRLYRDGTGLMQSITYNLPGAVFYRGLVSLTGGSFSGSFIVPEDISYSQEPASIIAYGWDRTGDNLEEAIGNPYNILILGSSSENSDSTGPMVSLERDGLPVYSGEYLPQGAVIEVILSDPLGVNLTGDLGHTIRTWVDDEANAEEQNAGFEYDLDRFTRGRFAYQFEPSLRGAVSLTVESWDGANHRGTETFVLHLSPTERFDVSGVFNYPNPFTGFTEFTYSLSEAAEVEITVYSLNGAKVIEFASMGIEETGFHRLPAGGWNGRDSFGDEIANGAYLYRLRAETVDGVRVTRWGRLARLR